MFVLSAVGALSLKFRHILGINTTPFGLIFLLAPMMLTKPHYTSLGITPLVVGPIVYVSGCR